MSYSVGKPIAIASPCQSVAILLTDFGIPTQTLEITVTISRIVALNALRSQGKICLRPMKVQRIIRTIASPLHMSRHSKQRYTLDLSGAMELVRINSQTM